MCGIAGFYLPNREADPILLRRMNAALTHRGPDGEGYFVEGPVGMAMRRLAVIDLETGDQPIFNEDRSVVVVYNGEIYNYRDLRAELERLGHRFTTQSDTEVLVHGYEAWGDDLPGRLNGMFAFALWDARRKRLLLARDHLGIKPLYYALLPGGGLAFASELKALLPLDGWSREIDPLALDWFLATRYIPSPRTIYQGARKLPPAHRLTIGIGENLRIERYWDIAFTPDERRSEQEWSEGLRAILTAAVRRQMIADVPLGAFLSGGLDSSIIVGLMAQASAEPVRTFTVIFPGWGGLDESAYARMVAERFGTVHTEIAVEADVAREWPELARHLDEPFADPATLPTWLMARQTRQHVTVVLTGEGADELFQGYGWYGWPTPLPIPGFLAQPLRRFIQRWWSGRRGRHRLLALLAPDFGTLYVESILSSVSQAEERLAWYQPDWRAHLAAMAPRADLEDMLRERPAASSSRMQELDLKVWLEGDPLTKADRATMLASLEARVPFLDQEVVEWVARIPARWHRNGNRSKWLLRRAFADLLPPEIADRPKHAFEVPVGAWLRGPLRPYLENALADPSPLWRVLRPEPFQKMARQHLSGRRDFSRELWAFLHLAFWWALYG
ncbi:MAG TPA: asparagine synthase (glutamine-hydrolyzing) [Thermoflexus sp.]|nr:asparagine synthase (glutamine-hydrolyzing) [Thermoflexus sp.]